jgi:hypothetical protein
VERKGWKGMEGVEGVDIAAVGVVTAATATFSAALYLNGSNPIESDRI